MKKTSVKKYGLANWSVIPMRAHPNERSEMVSQLLFGDLYKVLKEKEKWVKIEVDSDSHVGWIDRLLLFEISPEAYFVYKSSPAIVLSSPYNEVSDADSRQLILPGSIIYNIQNNRFILGQKVYEIGEYATVEEPFSRQKIVETAMLYLNSPYLWGGKTPYGIDCSGFTQMVYRINGIEIPRDAYQQAEKGMGLSFLSEAKPGDLAFFDNEEGKIIHVGMILEGNKIIHASGQVKIDSIDHYGIFNADTQTYSHQLRIIQNIIQD